MAHFILPLFALKNVAKQESMSYVFQTIVCAIYMENHVGEKLIKMRNVLLPLDGYMDK
jgi:hypothetical protein